MNNLVYSTAKIKTQENSLLTYDKLVRLLEQTNITDCLKVLNECGYGQLGANYNVAINGEIAKSCDYIRSIIPEGYGVELLFTEFDFHNLKAILKAKYAGLTSYDDMLAPSGNFSIESLRNAVFEDMPRDFYEPFKEIILELSAYSAEHTISAKDIDLLCDRKTYSVIFNSLKKVKGDKKALEKYFKAKIDFANLSTFLRCKKQNLDKQVFSDSFIEGSELSLLAFLKIYDNGIDALPSAFTGTVYHSIIVIGAEEYAKSALTEFEVQCDNYLLNIFKKEKHNLFSVSCIVGYLLGKFTEGKNIRIILTGVKNSVDKNIIKIRLRELYA